MKKKLKILGIIVAILVIAWIIIFIVDRHQTLNLKEPIFAKDQSVRTTDLKLYEGLGYIIEVKTNITSKQVESTTMYMFGKVIAGAITELSNAGINEKLNFTSNYDNPIDAFFNKVSSEIIESTPARNLISELYQQAWKEEMNHAYDKLYEKAHPDIKDQVLFLKESNNDFAEKSYVLGLSGWSTAFGDIENLEIEEINYKDYPISYGTGSNAMTLASSSRIYKENTLYLFEILGETNYIFDENKYKGQLSILYSET